MSTRLRVCASIASVAFGLGSLTACSQDDEVDHAEPPQRGTASDTDDVEGEDPEVARLPEVRVDDSDDFADRTYVAMGDSYTSAPGVEPLEEGAESCGRSEVNYPKLVAGAYGGSTLVDVSCSGATTADLLAPQTVVDGTTVPPQIDAVDADVDVVTISTGGNDVGALTLLGGDCEEGSCAEEDIAAVQEGLEQVVADLGEVVEQVRERAPEARILIVGYPQIVPEGEGCDALPLEGSDLTLARLFNQEVANTLQRAAEQADVEFVSLWEPTQGHDLCAPDPWINDGDNDGAVPYHPFDTEQQAAAAAVIDVLDS